MENKAKAARAAYYREWKKKNPEKVKAAQERYWLKKAQQAEQNEQQTATTPGK